MLDDADLALVPSSNETVRVEQVQARAKAVISSAMAKVEMARANALTEIAKAMADVELAKSLQSKKSEREKRCKEIRSSYPKKLLHVKQPSAGNR
jgi:hypothetical protein